LGQKKGSRYVLRDAGRGFGDVPVFRVDADGKLHALGVLTPVRPDGFVFTPADGLPVHSAGLPWWLLDILPQGYLGRAYAAHVGTTLGLPSSLKEWTDNHAMRALLVHGHDMVGNLLLGPIAREKFLAMAEPTAIPLADKPAVGTVSARRAELLSADASRYLEERTSMSGLSAHLRSAIDRPVLNGLRIRAPDHAGHPLSSPACSVNDFSARSSSRVMRLSA
jgi:hypothetical protein